MLCDAGFSLDEFNFGPSFASRKLTLLLIVVLCLTHFVVRFLICAFTCPLLEMHFAYVWAIEHDDILLLKCLNK